MSLEYLDRAREARSLLAELEVLASYDAMRERAGHDYGCGQRASELRRRRLALEACGFELEGSEASALELAEAWRRVALPRYRRALTEARRSSLLHGRGTDGERTPTARRTLDTWRKLARVYGFEL